MAEPPLSVICAFPHRPLNSKIDLAFGGCVVKNAVYSLCATHFWVSSIVWESCARSPPTAVLQLANDFRLSMREISCKLANLSRCPVRSCIFEKCEAVGGLRRSRLCAPFRFKSPQIFPCRVTTARIARARETYICGRTSKGVELKQSVPGGLAVSKISLTRPIRKWHRW